MTNSRRTITLWVLVATVVLLASGFAASAAVGASPQTVIMNTVSSANNAKDDSDITIVSAQASSSVQFSIKYNYIGTWDMALQPIKVVHGHPACFTATGTWTNSVKINSVVKAYQETSTAGFCWLAHPVVINGVRYTAIKMFGGVTGSHCHNLAIPPSQHQPKPQIVGPVFDVRSLTSVKIPVQANARSGASVSGLRNCPGGSLSGTASGSGSVTGKIYVVISSTLILKSGGKVTAAIKNEISQQLKLAVEGKAKTNAAANLTIKCGAAPPPVTTTTNTTTTVQTTTTTTTPAPPTFTMSWDTINDIPAGTCRPDVLHVTNGSVAGQVKVHPDVGLVSDVDCKQPDAGQHSTLTIQIAAGDHDYTVYVYEPSDTSATSETLTGVPLVKDVNADTHTAKTSFTISHPTRA
jgi:hypothetical protein